MEYAHLLPNDASAHLNVHHFGIKLTSNAIAYIILDTMFWSPIGLPWYSQISNTKYPTLHS